MGIKGIRDKVTIKGCAAPKFGRLLAKFSLV